ncbi:hypothetical protein [Parasphingorhabdus flavimaris]|uniref:hypothetical protein n=1 Tax=Parasphingorhabdus flavimaris TaxID=266812 RepID=UPI0030018789
MENLEIIDLNGAREALAAIGVSLSAKQLRRAAEPDAHGKRKLPFFVDPIDGRLKINKPSLLKPYFKAAAEAEKHIKN